MADKRDDEGEGDFIPAPALDSRAPTMEGDPLLKEMEEAEEAPRRPPISTTETGKAITSADLVRPAPSTSTATGKTIISSDPIRPAASEKSPTLTPSSPNQTPVAKKANKLIVVSQFKSWVFYQALISEFLGTFFLTLIATSTGLPITGQPVPGLHGSLVSGFVVTILIVGFGHTSGAHINPAVTVSFLTVREIDLLRGICYIVVQLLAAICASLLLWSIVPDHAQDYLGMTMITKGVTISTALIIEFFITFLLCFTVQAICDKNRDDIGGSKALMVGLAVTIGCLFGGPYTGGSMNPARSFGPALVMGIWTHHWVYWVAPLLGGICAALIYKRNIRKVTPPPPVAAKVDRSNYI